MLFSQEKKLPNNCSISMTIKIAILQAGQPEDSNFFFANPKDSN
jgi:hypothetical protein